MRLNMWHDQTVPTSIRGNMLGNTLQGLHECVSELPTVTSIYQTALLRQSHCGASQFSHEKLCWKKKTRRWERRVSYLLLSEFTVSSMRPDCWPLLLTAMSQLLLLFQPVYFLLLFLSCSSNWSKFNRNPMQIRIVFCLFAHSLPSCEGTP